MATNNMMLLASGIDVLNRIIASWDDVPRQYKKGFQLGDDVYSPLDQLRIIKRCAGKKRPSNADYKSLTLVADVWRHTILKDQYKTIRTSTPAYVRSYIKYKGKTDNFACPNDAVLYCNNEVLVSVTGVEIDMDDLNKYILETHGEEVTLALEDLSLGIDTSLLTETVDVTQDEYSILREEFEKEWCRIQKPLCYMCKNEFGLYAYTFKQVQELTAHMWVTQGAKKDGVADPFINIWKEDPNKRAYKMMDMFPPPLVCPENVFNLWSGFDIKGVASSGNCDLFLNHLDLVKGGKEYLINWMAHLVQRPGVKTLICPILRGKPGSGKSLIVDVIVKMLGPELAHSTGKMGQVFEKHGQSRKGRIFINIDEVDARSGCMHNETFKNAITAKTFDFEPKGVNESVLTNFNNFMVTTNYGKSIVYQEGERRYGVFDMDDSKVGNHEYFDALVAWYANDDNIAALFEYLTKVDLTNVNLKKPPETDALIDTKILNLPGIVSWFKYRVIDDCPASWAKHSITNGDLFDDFVRFTRINREEYNIVKFGKALQKNLEECSGLIKSRLKTGVVWNIDRQKVFDWFVSKKYTTDTELPPVVEIEFSTDH